MQGKRKGDDHVDIVVRVPSADHCAQASGPNTGATCDPAGIGQARACSRGCQSPDGDAARELKPDPRLDRHDAALVVPPPRRAPRTRAPRRAGPARHRPRSRHGLLRGAPAVLAAASRFAKLITVAANHASSGVKSAARHLRRPETSSEPDRTSQSQTL